VRQSAVRAARAGPWRPSAQRETVVVITRILCPLTLSDASRWTFEHALAMGEWYHASVVALHVFARWMPPAGLGTYPGWMRQIPEARVQIDQELDDLLEPAEKRGRHVPLIVREGNVPHEIQAGAADLGADLIVLGAHEPRRFDRLAHEPIPERVVRSATCTVLVVAPPRVASSPVAGYRRIVSATDFSACSRAAVGEALSIAEHAGATLTLLHVVESADARQLLNNADADETPKDAEFETARGLLRATVTDCGGRVCGISDVVRAGVAAEEIVRLVGEIEADLVVVGLRGTRTANSGRVGSTTTQLLRRAPCSLLTVGLPQRHEERSA
jgi:nucleotide-binding universal stress UspA family protein